MISESGRKEGQPVVRFVVLGPVEASVDGRPLVGLAPRHQAVLAYLLLHTGTVMSAERLTMALWGDAPPDTARSQIHAAITAIRRVLRTVGADDVLVTRAAGYVVSPELCALDLAEFTSLVESGQGLSVTDPRAAADRLREALELWRGDALSGVNAEYAHGARARLEERRIATFERLADLELALGRNDDLVEQLTGWVAMYPLRERLVGQLMRALYAAGRQADALAAGRAYRQVLGDQQGLDPGRAFLGLEQAILRDQPAQLTAASISAPPPVTPVPVAPPELVGRSANFLPYDVPDFTGRLVELDRIVSGMTAQVCVIDGMAGVGKTTIAVHAAHRLADRYPDGQLFADLRAYTAGQPPISPAEALNTLLRQVGVPADQIPPDETDRSALWRAELARRSVLIVLDNAADAEHVRLLLPGATASLMLITSRRRLTDLDGAHTLSVDVLPATDAVALFTSIVGDRAQAEYAAVADVLRLCGHLPLAVRIAAARLHHRPQWTVAYLADRLRDERRRLTELATAERGVATAFMLSYQQLPSRQQKLFRLLGLHPGRDFDAYAAAALAELDAGDTETDLEQLLDTHVLAQHEPGRYTFHDLLREHARATGSAEDDDQMRHAALTRLVDHYLRTAAAVIDVVYPDTKHRRPQVPRPDPVRTFTGDSAAAWLDAERANLTAVCTFMADGDWPEHAMSLATILYRYLYDNAHHADARTIYTAALAAGRRTGDRVAQSRALADLGWLSFGQGVCTQAEEHFQRAVEQAVIAGDQLSQARALHGLASARQQRRDDVEAMKHFAVSLELFRAQGDRFGQAVVLNSLGALHSEAGRFDAALSDLTLAGDLFRRLGSHGGEADVLDNLGHLHRRQGGLAAARDTYQEALRIYHQFGYRRGEARALNGLGAVAADATDHRVAEGHYRAALDVATEVGNRLEQARALEGLAYAGAARSAAAAGDHAAQALDLYAQLGEPQPPRLRNLLSR
jgi:DNA-binding SARP family transcriptional activator/tetratricopeptide (TPR) repeat protein